MSVATRTQRDAIRGMLADLKMPGSLQAVDGILSEVDGGRVAATDAISRLGPPGVGKTHLAISLAITAARAVGASTTARSST